VTIPIGAGAGGELSCEGRIGLPEEVPLGPEVSTAVTAD